MTNIFSCLDQIKKAQTTTSTHLCGHIEKNNFQIFNKIEEFQDNYDKNIDGTSSQLATFLTNLKAYSDVDKIEK